MWIWPCVVQGQLRLGSASRLANQTHVALELRDEATRVRDPGGEAT